MAIAVADLIRGEPLLASAYEAARQRIDDVAELAFDKLIAHLDDPKKHPMPSKANSLERALYRLVEKKPDRVRRKFVRDHKDRLAPAARRQRYGVLAEVDLTRPVPVIDLLAKPLRKEFPAAPAAERKRIAEKLAAFRPPPAEAGKVRGGRLKKGSPQATAAAGSPTPRGAFNRIVLRLEKVVCQQKTMEMFEGADEMKLAINGFTIDDLIEGRPRAVDIVDLGSFKDGDSRTLDNVSTALPLPPADELPADFAAILVAVEKDRFARDDSELDDVVAVVLLCFSAASQAVAIFGVLLGLIIGLAMTTIWWLAIAAGFLMGLGFTAAMIVRRRLGDDVFEPERVQVEVASTADVFPSETTVLRNEITDVGQRRGKYALTYRWELV